MYRQQKRKRDDFLRQNTARNEKTAHEKVMDALDKLHEVIKRVNKRAKEEAEDRDWEEQEFETLEKERDEALEMAAQAKREAAKARDQHEKKVDLMKKQFDNTLAIKEAKIASLESRVANINALLREDSPVAQTVAPKYES